MKVRNTLLQILGIAALVTTPVVAQSSLRVEVNVPFSFQAGDLHLPAGAYMIKAEAGSPALFLQNLESRETKVILAGVPIRDGDRENANLKFRVYGDKHYLASIWSPVQVGGRELSPSKAEQEAASAGVPFKVAVLTIKH